MDALVSCLTDAHTATGDAAAGPEPLLVVVATADELARTTQPHPDQVDPADALTDLFTGIDLLAPADDPATARTTKPRRWSACTRGGVPLGPRSLSALLCTSRLTRLLLSPAGHPLDSSPTARQLSRRERRALEHRARYRCERHGCGRPAAVCVPHHVVPFALGGLSTLHNTVLLCASCHHQLHDRQQPLTLTDQRRIGPRGWIHGEPDP